MTTKTSPPNSATNSTTNVKIKKEIQNDEIKDFAATAMNELLGWYGYDGVDRLDLSAKTSRLMQHVSNEIDSSQQKQQPPPSSHHRNTNTNTNTNSSSNRSEFADSKFGSQRGDSTTSDHDTRSRSSREDSKSPNSIRTMMVDKQEPNCGWCRRLVPENSPDFLTTPDGPRYCSESCFGQSRRACFKKAKTCDWCKHVRHAVSYVDFQDGASQLQFCSDKCLNQYKMQIFCKETQAHLDMNPHLKEKGMEATNVAALITPDLWLRNCRSRSASPASTVSVSPTPPAGPVAQHKPMISVAPVAKLMSKSPGIMSNRQSPKHSRKKRPVRNGPVTNNNHLVNSLNSGAGKSKASTPSPSVPPPPKPSAPHFPNAQDLRLNASPHSPIDGSHAVPRLPHALFAQNFPPNYANRLPFLPTAAMSHAPNRFLGVPPPQIVPPEIANFSSLLGAAPPITIMVPYPIIIPLPIPIPIPLPIIDFLKAAELPKREDPNPSTSQQSPAREDDEQDEEPPAADQPLDFTKARPEPQHTPPPAADPTPPPVEPNDGNDADDDEIEGRIPKLKITRLHTKRLITKESECSRPLRKRKRVIDCDYQKMDEPEETSASATSSKRK